MNMRAALSRTLLLMRDEVGATITDDALLKALTGTSVALIADDDNICSHAAQSCFVTAALLMARSGHRVHLVAPDLLLVGPQPPLLMGGIVTALVEVGANLLPSSTICAEAPADVVDLAVAFGNTTVSVSARRVVRLNAGAWVGSIVPNGEASPFGTQACPLGAMVAGVLAASEAFKIAMHALAGHFLNPARLHSVFAPSDRTRVVLAPEETPCASCLGTFDCVSGGAIAHAILYALARVPNVAGCARVIEPDYGDLTNLNRYMLLTSAHVGLQKANALAAVLESTGLRVTPVPCRFDPDSQAAILPFAPCVLVGVDDIPSRWLAQRQHPKWLTVGATTHWCAMASFHHEKLACAQCLHPVDEPDNGPVPTVAFVSFWAGLLTASYYLQWVAGHPPAPSAQQTFMTPFRAENLMTTGVARRATCPACSDSDVDDRASGAVRS